MREQGRGFFYSLRFTVERIAENAIIVAYGTDCSAARTTKGEVGKETRTLIGEFCGPLVYLPS